MLPVIDTCIKLTQCKHTLNNSLTDLFCNVTNVYSLVCLFLSLLLALLKKYVIIVSYEMYNVSQEHDHNSLELNVLQATVSDINNMLL